MRKLLGVFCFILMSFYAASISAAAVVPWIIGQDGYIHSGPPSWANTNQIATEFTCSGNTIWFLDSSGKIWTMNTTNNQSQQFSPQPHVQASKIAVDGNGNPWILGAPTSSSPYLWGFDGSSWKLYGEAANEFAIFGNTCWFIAGGVVYQADLVTNKSGPVSGAPLANKIALDGNGNPWIIGQNDGCIYSGPSAWTQYKVTAIELAISGNIIWFLDGNGTINKMDVSTKQPNVTVVSASIVAKKIVLAPVTATSTQLNTALSGVTIATPPTVANITSIQTIIESSGYTADTAALAKLKTLIGALFDNRASATEATYSSSLVALITAAVSNAWVGSDTILTGYNTTLNAEITAAATAASLNKALSGVTIATPPTVANITSIKKVIAGAAYTKVTTATAALAKLKTLIGALFDNRASATEATYSSSLVALITDVVSKAWVGSDTILTGYNTTLNAEITGTGTGSVKTGGTTGGTTTGTTGTTGTITPTLTQASLTASPGTAAAAAPVAPTPTTTPTPTPTPVSIDTTIQNAISAAMTQKGIGSQITALDSNVAKKYQTTVVSSATQTAFATAIMNVGGSYIYTNLKALNTLYSQIYNKVKAKQKLTAADKTHIKTVITPYINCVGGNPANFQTLLTDSLKTKLLTGPVGKAGTNMFFVNTALIPAVKILIYLSSIK